MTPLLQSILALGGFLLFIVGFTVLLWRLDKYDK